jgi:hypothetical protein
VILTQTPDIVDKKNFFEKYLVSSVEMTGMIDVKRETFWHLNALP